MTTLSLTIREEGRIAKLTQARKYHRCVVCQKYMYKDDQYYSVTVAGSGLGGIKFPSHVHTGCIDQYFEKVKASRKL